MSDRKKNGIIVLLTILAILPIYQNPAIARSVYAIPDHWGVEEALLNVYHVLESSQEGQLEYRATYDLKYGGAADVAIDTQSDILFITFENQYDIQLVNAKTFLSEGLTIADGATNLAGLELDYIDPNTTLLYTVDRGTNKLFVYDWDADTKTLTIIPPDPPTGNDYYELLPENPESDPSVKACGLVLDNNTGRLYVSQYDGSIIQVYDVANDFEHVETIDLNDYFEGINNYAVDIDIDTENGWLYAGGYQGHRNLLRHDLNDPNNNHVEEIVETGYKGVIGLAVSQGTNMIYMTTYNKKLEAWNIAEWDRIDGEAIDDGAGVCVAEVDFVPPFMIEKDDDIEGCVSPRGEEITYTICYDYMWDEETDLDPCDFDSLSIIDYLPKEVGFVSASDYGQYDENEHSVTWDVNVEAFDPNCVELVVEGSKNVIPGGEIENVAEIIATITIEDKEKEYFDRDIIKTEVCDCSEYGNIIYVDDDADSGGDGTGWDKAFNELQDALAEAWPCDEVRVAEGTYNPTTNPSNPRASFVMINTVGVYGGFESWEEERYERNWFDNETVLSGIIDSFASEPNCVDYVVVSDANAPVSALDGFTITGGALAGIFCENSSPIIQHNKITDNAVGIYCFESEQPVIKNNCLYKNNYGLYLDSPSDTAIVRNNTMANNEQAGIYLANGIEPGISNCIFTGQPEGYDLIGCDATYSYIDSPATGEGNIDGDPNFPPFVAGVDDYHLDPCSACIDAGDPNGKYGSERDIDKHFRVLDGDGVDGKRVDMGADEYCNETSSNDADFNGDGVADGVVNYIDFAIFAKAWLSYGPYSESDPNTHNWNEECDISEPADNVIDANDLIVFAEEWLWMSCEGMKDIPMMEMMMGMGKMMGMESMLTSETTTLTPATQQQISKAQPQAEPSFAEQIEQIKELLDWLYEVKDTIDEKTWLSFVTSLEEMLKELEDSQ